MMMRRPLALTVFIGLVVVLAGNVAVTLGQGTTPQGQTAVGASTWDWRAACSPMCSFASLVSLGWDRRKRPRPWLSAISRKPRLCSNRWPEGIPAPPYCSARSACDRATGPPPAGSSRRRLTIRSPLLNSRA